MRLPTPLPHAIRAATCALALAAAGPAFAAGVHVSLTPQSTTVASGTTFTVKARVLPADAAFNAFDLLVRFDPTRLQYVASTNAADSVVTSACGNRFQIFKLLNAQPADPDTLSLNLSLLCANVSMTGPGAIYRWQFKALAPGTTTLSLVGGTAFYDAGQVVTPVETHDMTVTIPCPAIAIAPASLPDGVEGAAYTQSLTGSGGVAPYTFTLASGALPAGLALSPAGAITGTPTATGPASFGVTAADANGCTAAAAYAIAVACPTLTIAPATLPAATVGAAYSQALVASGGGAPYTFALASGALPPGLTLAPDGVLSGTPTAAGTSDFGVTANDAAGCSRTVAYSLAADCPAIALEPASLPAGAPGTPYSVVVSATGGSGPYGFAVTAGQPPAGLALDADGTLSGTPTTPGDATFTVTAADTYGCSGALAYTVSVACPDIAIAPDTLPAATAGAAYAAALTASGGAGPYAFALDSGALPVGVTLAADGTLAGTPAGAGLFAFTAGVTDTNGCTATRGYTIAVGCATLAITPESLPQGAAGDAYEVTLRATYGTEPYTYAIVDGALPDGLELAADGTLSGTPVALAQATFRVRATDAGGCEGEREYTLAVGCAAIAIARDSATAHVNLGYTSPLGAVGGTGPYTFQLVDGALPAGLALEDGVISGTPESAGTYAFTLLVADANDCSATLADTIEVVETLGVADGAPVRFALEAVLPNPRAPGVAGLVTFALPRAATVRIELFDLSGRRVAARLPEAFPAGRHRAAWSLPRLVSGVYLVRVRPDAGAGAVARWIVLP